MKSEARSFTIRAAFRRFLKKKQKTPLFFLFLNP